MKEGDPRAYVRYSFDQEAVLKYWDRIGETMIRGSLTRNIPGGLITLHAKKSRPRTEEEFDAVRIGEAYREGDIYNIRAQLTTSLAIELGGVVRDIMKQEGLVDNV